MANIISAIGNNSLAETHDILSIAAATGLQSKASISSHCSIAVNFGECGEAEALGGNSIAFSGGLGGRAKGNLGDWIILIDWDYDGESEPFIMNILKARIDGKEYKPNTWYTINDGIIMEDQ